jgi:hypothetical protein
MYLIRVLSCAATALFIKDLAHRIDRTFLYMIRFLHVY